MKVWMVLVLCVGLARCILQTEAFWFWGKGEDGHEHDGDEKVLTTDIEVLTLRRGQQTNTRRGVSRPQLKCLGSWWWSNCRCFVPPVVHCYSKYEEGHKHHWDCKAEEEAYTKYKLGDVKIFCEGYDYRHDPYILKGSCGIEYTLVPKEGSAKGNYGSLAAFVFVMVITLLCLAVGVERVILSVFVVFTFVQVFVLIYQFYMAVFGEERGSTTPTGTFISQSPTTGTWTWIVCVKGVCQTTTKEQY